MVTQAFLQFGSCPVQSDFDHVEADLKDFGNLTVFKAFDLAEDKNRSVIFRELIDISPNTAIHLLMNQLLVDILLLFTSPDILVFGLGLVLAGWIIWYAFPRLLLKRGTVLPVQCGIGRNAVNPGGKLGLTPEFLQRLIDLDENLLSQILGLVFTEHA